MPSSIRRALSLVFLEICKVPSSKVDTIGEVGSSSVLLSLKTVFQSSSAGIQDDDVDMLFRIGSWCLQNEDDASILTVKQEIMSIMASKMAV